MVNRSLTLVRIEPSELTKRLITHRAVVDALSQAVEQQQRRINQQLSTAVHELAAEVDDDLNVQSFRELNRLPQETEARSLFTGQVGSWAMDGASDYLKDWVNKAFKRRKLAP
jgi:hypothetical protein